MKLPVGWTVWQGRLRVGARPFFDLEGEGLYPAGY
jgi:hypothetical protein